MKQFNLFKFFSFSTLLFFSLYSNGQTVPALDPDLPKQAQSTNKETYLKNRDEYISQKRGLPHNLPYDPRAKAIAQKQLQEDLNKNNPNFILSAPNWVAEGPFPIPNGQTTGFSVAVSGRVTSIAVHPTNANIVYAGTANGGVYRSLNGGTSWTSIFDNAQSLAIGALALAPSDPTILYVGTGEAALSQDSYFGVGLYRIDNADVAPSLVGPINPGGIFTYRSISKILVDPTNAANIFVSTASGIGGIINVNPATASRGVFRSTNATAAAGSVAFTKLTVATAVGGNRSVIDMVMEPGTPNNIICTVYGLSNAGDGGIYRSTDALAATPTFTRTLTLGTGSGSWRCELAICKVAGTTTVYAGLDTAGNAAVRSIQKSVDGGVTWAPTALSFGFCGGQCFYDIALAVDPGNASNLYIGGAAGSNIFNYSVNGGASFTASATNLHADVHSIVVAPSAPTTIYLGCDGGIFKSTNSGVTWASMNTAGFSATQFQSLAIHPTDTKFTIAGSQDNGTSMYKPDGSWNRIDFGDGGYTLIDQNAADNTNVTMYHTYFNQANNLAGLARVDAVASAIDGNWGFYGCNGSAGNGISCSGTILFYAPIALGPGNPNTVYFCSDRLYRSVNKGTTFTTVSQSPIVTGTAISTVAIAKQDDNYRLVGLTNGQVWGTSTGSSTLENITPAGAPAAPVQRVYFDPNNKNIAYICYGGYGVTAGQHIWKATNYNVVSAPATWAASGSGIPDVPVNAFAIDPGNSNILYAGTDIGVYSSTDAGATWSSFSTGLPIVPVFDMVVHPVSRNLRIATHGRGLWSTSSVLLPITLSSFNVNAKDNGKVYLEWITEFEQNNKGFEIERMSEAGVAANIWEKIGFVNGSGNSTSPKRYYFEDEPLGGKFFYYRLKQVDNDGKYKYSDIKTISLRNFDYGLYQCYPNPVTNTGIIKYKIPVSSHVNISLFDNSGKLIATLLNENKGAGIYQISIPSQSLSAGLYHYKIEAGGFSDSKTFTVIK